MKYHSDIHQPFFIIVFMIVIFSTLGTASKKSQTTKNQYLRAFFTYKQILVIQNVTYEIFFTQYEYNYQYILFYYSLLFFCIYKLHVM